VVAVKRSMDGGSRAWLCLTSLVVVWARSTSVVGLVVIKTAALCPAKGLVNHDNVLPILRLRFPNLQPSNRVSFFFH